MKSCIKCKERKGADRFNPKRPLYCLRCEPVRKSRAPAAVLNVDFEKETRRLLTVLHRDIGKLMEASHAEKLDPDESASLVTYLKLISELRAMKLLEETQKEIQND